MHDPRLHQLADVIVRYSTAVRPGDLVTIVGEPQAMPAVEALFGAILRAGGHPSFHAKCDSLNELVLRGGSDEQLRHVCPFEAFRLERCDVLIVLVCPVNTKSLSGIDPARAAMQQAARREIIARSLQRGAEGKLRYCLSEIPSQAAAQDAEMSLTEYADWVFRAGMLHLPDPVAAWRRLHEQQGRAAEFLMRKNVIQIRSPACDGVGGARRHDGTDVAIDVSGRTWLSRPGDENFPDGEIDTGPRSVDGVVNFTFPGVYRGREVDGVRLRFRDGRVVEASAARNEAHLLALLDLDDGARVVGELGIGTNFQLTRFVRNAFFDEKIGGTFHLALGFGYPPTGNTNTSGLHWDLVSDLRPGGTFAASQGGTIHADGERIQQDGRFTLPGWPGDERHCA